MRVHGFALALCMAFAPLLSEHVSGSPDVTQLLERCLQSQGIIDKVSLHCTTEMDAKHFENKPLHQRQELWLRMDGLRVDVSGRRLYLDKMQDQSNQFRGTTDGKYWVSYQFPFAKANAPTGGTVTEAKRDQFAKLQRGQFTNGGPLDGWLAPGDKRLVQIVLDSGNARLGRPQIIKGTECQTVESRTSSGTITLWLAESKGCLPLQFTVHREPAEMPIQDRKWRDTPTVVWKARLDDVELAPIYDAFVPVRGILTEYFRLEDGREAEMTYRYYRTKISLAPDFKGPDAFSTDLPNGAPVTNLDDNSGVNYVWNNHSIIRAATVFAGEDAIGAWPASAWLAPLLWVAVGGACMGAAGVLLRRWRRG